MDAAADNDTTTRSREDRVQEAYEAYDFGYDVVDSDGWEHVHPSDEWTRRITLRHGTPAFFTVKIKSGSNEVEDAYAIDLKGQIFGNMPR